MRFNKNNFRFITLTFAVLVAIHGQALGQTNFYSFSWVGSGDDLSNGTDTRFYDSHSGTTPVTSLATGSTTYTDDVDGDMQLTGTGKGRSGYLNIGTYADATLTNAHVIAAGNTGQYYQTAGIAGYTSNFTIFGPSLVQNDIYKQRFNFSLDGTTTTGDGIDSHAFIFLHVGADDPEGSYIFGNTVFQSAYHTFQPGVSNAFQLEMDSSVDIKVDSLTAGSTATGTTDFYHSLVLTGIDILDSNGNAVKDFGVRDANTGELVFASGSVVPEPASMAAIGMGVIALIRRRKASK